MAVIRNLRSNAFASYRHNMQTEVSGAPVSLDDVRVHLGSIRSVEPLIVESSTQQWAYAVSIQLPPDDALRVPIKVSVTASVESGELQLLVVGDDFKTQLGPGATPVGPGSHVIDALWQDSGTAHLVFRNSSAANAACVFRVDAVHVAPGEVAATTRLEEVTGGSGSLDLGRLGKALGRDGRTVDRAGLDIVPVDLLHRRLDIATPLDYPEASREKRFADWKMEVDDAPILRYLYRHVRPKRHLEFGTWEGTGVCLCLEECDATAWTINLAEGETIGGRPAYFSTPEEVPAGAVPLESRSDGDMFQTDAGVFIGHRYRAAGFGPRVCQIYCDSREWDTSAYPAGFFDSALIDGGHTRDVVLSDTRKALDLVRPGGMILWHDFCPDPAVFSAQPAVTGVIGGLLDEWPAIRASLQDVFWIRPSFLLVGVTAK
jgi:hypothetical protein